MMPFAITTVFAPKTTVPEKPTTRKSCPSIAPAGPKNAYKISEDAKIRLRHAPTFGIVSVLHMGRAIWEMSEAKQTGACLIVVSPAFNEEGGVPILLRAVHVAMHPRVTGRRLQVIIVDDGSSDNTSPTALQTANELRMDLDLIRLSKNFGQQAAIHAGLEHAFRTSPQDSLFLILDSDLQHPPELVNQMLQEIDRGFDHVQMVRNDDLALPALKRFTSSTFYKVFSALSGAAIEPGSSDFRLFRRSYLGAYLSYKEVNRFNRAIFVSLGFRTKKLNYEPAKRMAGATKYSLWKMLKLGFQGIVQFTNAPLIFSSLATFLLSLLVCMIYGIVELAKLMQGVQFAVGWPTMIFFVFFWGGLLSFNQFVNSLYVASIYNEVKHRPIFIVESVTSTIEGMP